MAIISIPANYYQQFDADWSLDAPGQGFGGWQKTDVEIDTQRTAVVSMHAWSVPTREAHPGLFNTEEQMGRIAGILQEVYPPLLEAVRRSDLPLYHVVGGSDYYSHYPGYQRAVALAGDPPALPAGCPERDPTVRRLWELKADLAYPGRHNRNMPTTHRTDFAPQARPMGDEGIARDAHQLAALCRADGVTHLIYVGFNINWCLLMSAGGMLDMGRRGFLCSTIAQATTAIENKESAGSEAYKAEGLWRVSIEFGFVFDLADVLARLPSAEG